MIFIVITRSQNEKYTIILTSQFMGTDEVAGKTWRARLSLTKMEFEANDFMAALAGSHDAHSLCVAISDSTGGVVQYAASSSTDHDKSTPPYKVEKRGKPKLTAITAQKSALDEEIAASYVGKNRNI